MKKITPREQINKRRELAFKELEKVVRSKKLPNGKVTRTYVDIGQSLGLTSQTVFNYINGKGGDGYVIDALIEEFQKLPISPTTL